MFTLQSQPISFLLILFFLEPLCIPANCLDWLRVLKFCISSSFQFFCCFFFLFYPYLYSFELILNFVVLCQNSYQFFFCVSQMWLPNYIFYFWIIIITQTANPHQLQVLWTAVQFPGLL